MKESGRSEQLTRMRNKVRCHIEHQVVRLNIVVVFVMFLLL